MKYKVRLNLKALVIAEKLKDKPFSSFDFEDEDDVIALLYGMIVANNDILPTLKEFEEMVNSGSIKGMDRKIEETLAFIGQFGKDEGYSDGEVFMTDISSLLIMSGVDPHYVMYEMDIFEIEGFLKQYENNKKERMEEGRLWSYLVLSPHLKRGTSPSDMYPFPWEEEERKKQLEIKIKEEKINEFFLNGGEFFKKIKYE